MHTPRWYQNEAVKSVYDYFALGNAGNPVVALPTGTGKELVQTMLVKSALERWPRQRFMCLTHVKELIKQNEAGMRDNWPDAPTGIYSAGLKRRDVHAPIVYGGVASVVKNIEQFGHRDLLIVDECHLMSGKDASMYGRVIEGLKRINPYLKVVGLTATCYRQGMGLLTNGGVFTDICYDMTDMQNFNLLISQGFLCPIRPKRPDTEIDVSRFSLGADNDYNEAEVAKAVDIDAITNAAVHEMVQHLASRNHCLVFGASVKHVEHIADRFRKYGVPTSVVHGELKDDVRDENISDFKTGKNIVCINHRVLTTGFNFPALDMIGMLLPTNSTGLWVQMLGRLTRPAPGKEYGLVMDFAGNTARLGPINDPNIPHMRGKKTVMGVAPVKICPVCGFYNHTRATICINCPHLFDMRPKITGTAGIHELLRTEAAQVEIVDVMHTHYSEAPSPSGNKPYLRVTYFCGPMGQQRYYDFVKLEHGGFSSSEAKEWWKSRYMGDNTARIPSSFAGYVPSTVREALQLTNNLKTPRRLRVQTNLKHAKVLGHHWN